MPGSLPKDDVQFYRENGYHFPYRLMPRNEALAIADRILEFGRSNIPKRYQDPQNQLYVLKAHLIYDWADRISHNEGLLDAVESLIGPNIMIWSSGVFSKGPKSGSYVSWHQDATNFELDNPEGVVRAWCALTPANLDNGTMRFLPGGHRLGQVPHVDQKKAGELLSRGETMSTPIDETKTVPVIVDAGEVSFHHLHTPHASGPNDSNAPRVNYVITYIDTKVAPQIGPDSAMLVRGRDGYGHFEPEPRPKGHMDADALKAHRHYMTMRYQILYRGATPPPPPPHGI